MAFATIEEVQTQLSELVEHLEAIRKADSL